MLDLIPQGNFQNVAAHNTLISFFWK